MSHDNAKDVFVRMTKFCWSWDFLKEGVFIHSNPPFYQPPDTYIFQRLCQKSVHKNLHLPPQPHGTSSFRICSTGFLSEKQEVPQSIFKYTVKHCCTIRLKTTHYQTELGIIIYLQIGQLKQVKCPTHFCKAAKNSFQNDSFNLP